MSVSRYQKASQKAYKSSNNKSSNKYNSNYSSSDNGEKKYKNCKWDRNIRVILNQKNNKNQYITDKVAFLIVKPFKQDRWVYEYDVRSAFDSLLVNAIKDVTYEPSGLNLFMEYVCYLDSINSPLAKSLDTARNSYKMYFFYVLYWSEIKENKDNFDYIPKMRFLGVPEKLFKKMKESLKDIITGEYTDPTAADGKTIWSLNADRSGKRTVYDVINHVTKDSFQINENFDLEDIEYNVNKEKFLLEFTPGIYKWLSKRKGCYDEVIHNHLITLHNLQLKGTLTKDILENLEYGSDIEKIESNPEIESNNSNNDDDDYIEDIPVDEDDIPPEDDVEQEVFNEIDTIAKDIKEKNTNLVKEEVKKDPVKKRKLINKIKSRRRR